MRLLRSLPAWMLPGLLALSAGCASPGPPPVDLAPARKAVEEASAAARSGEALAAARRARERLGEAERLAVSRDVAERRRAGDLAELATLEARCARLLDGPERPPVPAPSAPPPADSEAEKLRARLRRSVDEQRRLEERITVLQKDLEATETEVIRTKARLKGIETKAEASSAIAEAHTLLLRRRDEKARSADVSRAGDKLARAEAQLRERNYGAAIFFALQAQELLGQPIRSRAGAPKVDAGGKPAQE